MEITAENGIDLLRIDSEHPHIVAARRSGASTGGPELGRWLVDTPLLRIGDPKVRIQSAKLTQLCHGMRLRAMACFEFVQALPYAFPGSASPDSAEQVLSEGRGSSLSKGTLLVALLRASGIPARLRMVAMKSEFLWGISDTRGLPVEHAMTEVWLGARWLCLDAYIPDFQFSLAARARLLREGRRCGLGLHARGRVLWNGTADALASCDPDDVLCRPIADFGVFDDPAAFRLGAQRSRENVLTHAARSLGTAVLNRRVTRIRGSLGEATARIAFGQV